VTDESQLQVRPKGSGPSLSPSKARSGIVARGRADAAVLTGSQEEGPEERSALFDAFISDFLLNRRPTEEVRKDAESGDAKQQSILAYWYRLWSIGSPDRSRNLAEAAKWFNKAADQGYAPAQFNLGWMFDNISLGVPSVGQDYAEAAAHYRKAADQFEDSAEPRLVSDRN
jgi:TPR repeat protein